MFSDSFIVLVLLGAVICGVSGITIAGAYQIKYSWKALFKLHSISREADWLFYFVLGLFIIGIALHSFSVKVYDLSWQSKAITYKTEYTYNLYTNNLISETYVTEEKISKKEVK
jgi:hypothetical protein